MSTTAAVYVEEFDVTVRIDGDGYPSNTKRALERFVDQDLLERFVEHSEYSFICSTQEDYDRYQDSFGDRYVKVPGVGFAFPEFDAIQLETTVGPQGYVFENNENYEYIVRGDGVVLLHKGEEEE